MLAAKARAEAFVERDMILSLGRGAWRGLALTMAFAVSGLAADQVRTNAGLLEGAGPSESGVRAFLGIPFAAPPVGDLRWRAPQPVAPWTGVRKATAFGSRCTQGRIFDDMVFRDEPSEDCLYLNVWTPAKSASEHLPVMVWIYGGGFQAGSASEPRQDGGRLARKGVVVVSMNYRLGVFGFLAHPALTKESGHGASGNYGAPGPDRGAAVGEGENVAAFGGDPGNVTIFGESAGSFAVSALMASPLARGLVPPRHRRERRALHARQGRRSPLPRSRRARRRECASRRRLGEPTRSADLRGSVGRRRPAGGAQGTSPGSPRASTATCCRRPRPRSSPRASRARCRCWRAGTRTRSAAGSCWRRRSRRRRASPKQAHDQFGDQAEAILKVYPATTDAEALESAAALASDLFIGHATWQWIEAQRKTGGSPVYRYSFDRKIPVAPGTKVDGVPATADDIGARHAGEIEYVFGALDCVPDVTWKAEDRRLSDLMMSYWANFARSGDPNGPGLPPWPRYGPEGGFQVMHLDVKSQAAPDTLRARYETLDALTAAPAP